MTGSSQPLSSARLALTGGPRWVAPAGKHPSDVPAPARVVVFAHAGAGPQSYRRLLQGLASSTQVLAVTLPGRERRRHEPPALHLEAVVAAVGDELSLLEPLPTVLYGHSLGAILALRVAAAIPSVCQKVVLSAAVPGVHSLPGAPRSPDALLKYFLTRHHLPIEALEDPHELTPAQRALAYDLSLASQASALGGPEHWRVAMDLTTIAGSDDLLVPPQTQPNWSSYTAAVHTAVLVEGGHFFPFHPAGRTIVTGILNQALQDVQERTWATAPTPSPRPAIPLRRTPAQPTHSRPSARAR